MAVAADVLTPVWFGCIRHTDSAHADSKVRQP
jgi:hypothetical protein